MPAKPACTTRRRPTRAPSSPAGIALTRVPKRSSACGVDVADSAWKATENAITAAKKTRRTLTLLTSFQIRDDADEWFEAVEERAPRPVAGPDPTVEQTAEQIRVMTRDFVLKTLATDSKGHAFEAFVAQLLNAMGDRTHVTRKSVAGGIDVIAHKDHLGLEPPLVKVPVKRVEGTVGDPEVSALDGEVRPQECGMLVTLGTFSSRTRSFAESKSNLRLVDGAKLVDLILEQYESFAPAYQGMLPLRRVDVPDPVGTSDSEE